MEIKIKIKEFKQGTVTAGETWNDSAYDTIETNSVLRYEYDGVSCRVSGKGATYEDLVEKAIKQTSWETWFYEEEGEFQNFNALRMETPSIYDEETGDYLSVKRVGDFIDNCRDLMPKSEYEAIKEQLINFALDYNSIVVIDEEGEEMTLIKKTINFKIENKEFPEIYQEGYVEIPYDEYAQENWFFLDYQGFPQYQKPYTHYDGECERADIEELIEEFEINIGSNLDFVDEVIFTSQETDKTTYEYGDLKITVGEE